MKMDENMNVFSFIIPSNDEILSAFILNTDLDVLLSIHKNDCSVIEAHEVILASGVMRLKEMLDEKEILNRLCQKYDMDEPVATYYHFYRLYIMNTLPMFRLRKACNRKNYDLVEEILTTNCLWCSHEHIEEVCRNLAFDSKLVERFIAKYKNYCEKRGLCGEFSYQSYDDPIILIYNEVIKECCRKGYDLSGYDKKFYKNNQELIKIIVGNEQWHLLKFFDNIPSKIKVYKEALKQNNINFAKKLCDLGCEEITIEETGIPSCYGWSLKVSEDNRIEKNGLSIRALKFINVEDKDLSGYTLNDIYDNEEIETYKYCKENNIPTKKCLFSLLDEFDRTGVINENWKEYADEFWGDNYSCYMILYKLGVNIKESIVKKYKEQIMNYEDGAFYYPELIRYFADTYSALAKYKMYIEYNVEYDSEMEEWCAKLPDVEYNYSSDDEEDSEDSDSEESY